MFSSSAESCQRLLPKGCAAVPVSSEQLTCPLRLCVVVRTGTDPAGGRFVAMRDTMDARVLLGCLLDAGGYVHEWIELWIQDLGGLGQTAAVSRESMTNATLDKRWVDNFAALSQTDGDGIVRTGWETANPHPTFIDLSALKPVHPVHGASGLPWALCRDDAVLSAKGLAVYSGSLFRYLWVPELGADSPFVPVTSESPRNESCLQMADLADDSNLVAFNVGGGLMLARAHGAMTLEAFSCLLSRASSAGAMPGLSPTAPDGLASEMASDGFGPDGSGSGWLFLGSHGRPGRLVETLHLKLRLLADLFDQVRAAVARLGRPVLNLSADSFQVRLGDTARALPVLWTARAVLADAGDAVELPITGTEALYYLRGGSAGMSIYQPASAASAVRGRGTVRIRQVITESKDRIVLEGTFATQERMQVSTNDMGWMRLTVASTRLDTYAHLESGGAMAAGEWRFRTISQIHSANLVAALKAAEGVPMGGVVFDVVPLLSSPCDLYSLGVLAVRILLVDEETSLPIALDETFSLARQLAAEYEAGVPLAGRVQRLFEKDNRWVEALGPARLTHEKISPAEAIDLVPIELWCQVLAVLIGLFPGIGPDSECADFGDAPAGGPHRVFDRAIEELEKLLLRTRSLIVIDWRYNRHVHAVIRRHLIGMEG